MRWLISARVGTQAYRHFLIFIWLCLIRHHHDLTAGAVSTHDSVGRILHGHALFRCQSQLLAGIEINIRGWLTFPYHSGRDQFFKIRPKSCQCQIFFRPLQIRRCGNRCGDMPFFRSSRSSTAPGLHLIPSRSSVSSIISFRLSRTT